MTAGTPHLDLDALADLLAGEGTDEQLAHVGDCPVCAGALDDVDRGSRSVQAVLAALPPPVVPPELTARLERALAAEQQVRASPDTAGLGPAGHDGADEDDVRPGAVQAGGSVIALPRPRPARSPWPLRAAAAVVVCGLLAATGLALRGAGRDDSTTTSGTAAATADRPAPASAPGAGSEPETDAGTGSGAARAATDYPSDPAGLQAAVTALLRRGPQPPAALLSPPAPDDPLGRLRDPAALAGCLSALPGGAGRTPLALDPASVQGAPALVVVLPTGTPGTVEVVAVGPGCRAGDAQVLLARVVSTG